MDYTHQYIHLYFYILPLYHGNLSIHQSHRNTNIY